MVFKYAGKEWKRIPLQELPVELNDINLVISTKAEEKTITTQSPVSADLVKKLNSSLRQPEYRAILREPVKIGSEGSAVNCEELIPYGKAGWLGIDWFTDQPTYESCLKFCEQKGVSPKHCPCDRIFGR